MTIRKLSWKTHAADASLARLVFDSRTLAELGIDASELQPPKLHGEPVEPEGDLVPITLPDGSTHMVQPTVARMVEAMEKQLKALADEPVLSCDARRSDAGRLDAVGRDFAELARRVGALEARGEDMTIGTVDLADIEHAADELAARREKGRA